MNEKRVFVTVGTTKFEKLIETTTSDEILNILKNLGYTSVQYQTGHGTYKERSHATLSLKYQKYFENFEDEIEKYDLVIGHAGAGTCLQVFKKGKPLIIVINDDLMNNHQRELAEQLQKDDFVYYCTCSTLKDTLAKDLASLKPYPKPLGNNFKIYLDKCMGFIE